MAGWDRVKQPRMVRRGPTVAGDHARRDTTSYLIVRRVNCLFKMYLEKSSEIALDKVKCHGSLSKSKCTIHSSHTVNDL